MDASVGIESFNFSIAFLVSLNLVIYIFSPVKQESPEKIVVTKVINKLRTFFVELTKCDKDLYFFLFFVFLQYKVFVVLSCIQVFHKLFLQCTLF